MKRIAILGSTGSIGTSALAVIDANPDRLRVVGLAAGRNADALSAQIQRYQPAVAAIGEPSAVHSLAGGAPAGTPDEAVTYLHDAFAKGMQEKSFIDFMNQRGLTIRYMPTNEITEFAASNRPMFESLATEVNKTKPKQ